MPTAARRTRTARRIAVATMVGVVGLTGVARAAEQGRASRSPAETTAWDVPAGRVRAAIKRVDQIVRRVRDRTGVPGLAVAVVSKGRVVVAKGYGTTNTKQGRKVGATTVFELASLSKSVGATVVARAVDQGTVAWTDPVVKHLRDFRLSDPYVTAHVTIEDMYAHRSGLPAHAGDLLEDLGYDREQALARLRYLPLDPFRAAYQYTNFGMTAGAEAVARAAQTSWENLSRDLVYGPLGMTSTSSRFSDFADNPNRAAQHVREGKRWVAKYVRNADAQSPAGGVSSNARDMGRWMQMLLADGRFDGKRILSNQEVTNLRTARMTTAPLASPTARPSQYALGFNVGVDDTARLRLSHSGAFALGTGTAFAMSPAAKLGIVVLTNGEPVGAAEAISAEFLDRALVGRSTRDWLAAYGPLFEQLSQHPTDLGTTPPANARAAQANAAYVGTYESDFYGTLRVVDRGGGLVMVLGPEPTEFPLEHWTGNTFAYDTVGENASGRQAVTFSVSGLGATRVTVADLNDAYGADAELGVFTRK